MVAIAIGIQMAPNFQFKNKPTTMAISVFLLYLGCGLCAALSLLNPVLGILINFIYIGIIMIHTCVPFEYRSFIPFLLCYIFCQSSPVSLHGTVMRMIGIFSGALIMVVLILWKHRHQTQIEYLSYRECLQQSYTTNKGFVIRIVLGLSIAMFIGQAFHLVRPLWISIVVMSLTQRDFEQTKERVLHRIYVTVISSCLFVLLFQFLVPDVYTSLLILFIGYLMGFLTEY